eukprot:CAMPEP_0178569186 /NCGR_PEP_ID=MMETSP0697-20121206/16348_1 /TAXON_ID=265572 /ORGANISM="Extubocellulus spinifer, Strain CCMP396" /LENGTH=169 /DNA_ID=CAMNT_0020203417 /DNA_START=283 /DNA_END=789 /DNA_ORIENTATION=-
MVQVLERVHNLRHLTVGRTGRYGTDGGTAHLDDTTARSLDAPGEVAIREVAKQAHALLDGTGEGMGGRGLALPAADDRGGNGRTGRDRRQHQAHHCFTGVRHEFAILRRGVGAVSASASTTAAASASPVDKGSPAASAAAAAAAVATSSARPALAVAVEYVILVFLEVT